MNYQNFTIEISRLPSAEGLQLQNLDWYQMSLNAEGLIRDYHPVSETLPVSKQDIADFYQWVRDTRFDGHLFPGVDKDTTIAQAMGRKLFKFLFKNNSNFEEPLNIALAGTYNNDKGLRLCLKMWEAEINNLPWEYLFQETEEGTFFANQVETPIVRYIARNNPRPKVLPPEKLRIAAFVGGDLPDQPPRQKDWLTQLAELKKLVQKIQPEADFEILSPQNSEELSLKLTPLGQIHILHYLGHGEFDETSQKGQLILPQGKLTSADLSTLLNPQRELKLVVLSACYSAQAGLHDRFSSLATALSRVPAVVAMQFDVLQTTAFKLCQHLYHNLAYGASLEEAVAAARRAIWLHLIRCEFGVPVLYTRTEQPIYLFPPVIGVVPPPPPLSPPEISLEAQAQELAQRYQNLLDSFLRLELIAPEEREKLWTDWQRLADLQKKIKNIGDTPIQKPLEQSRTDLVNKQENLNQLLTVSAQRNLVSGNQEPKPGNNRKIAQLHRDVSRQQHKVKELEKGLGKEWGATPDYQDYGDLNFHMLDAATLLNRAVALYRSKDQLPLAAQYLELAAEKNKRNAEIRFWLGKVYLAQDQTAEAKEKFLEASNLSPKHLEIYLELAEICAKQGAHQEQLSYLNRAIALNPKNSAAQRARGLYYYQSENYQEAAASFEIVLKSSPSDADIYFRLGECYYKKEPAELRPALKAFDTFLTKSGERVDWQVNYAQQKLVEISTKLNKSHPNRAA